jgi:hypothetical protein
VSTHCGKLAAHVCIPIREAQFRYQVLLELEQLLVDGIALLRQTQNRQLDLGELMQSVQALGGRASATSFRSEAPES